MEITAKMIFTFDDKALKKIKHDYKCKMENIKNIIEDMVFNDMLYYADFDEIIKIEKE